MQPLIATIPPPPIQNIELGPLTLHLYGLLLGIGIIVGINVIERLLRHSHVPTERLLGVLLPSVIVGFIGARLYHVLSEPKRYAEAPREIIEIWNGGLGIWGGVAAGTICGVLLARRAGIAPRRLLDAAGPGIAFGQAIGRFGNYLNQELFGGPTDLPWALEVEPAFRPERFASEPTFHPTFLYESLADLAIAIALVVLYYRWRNRAPGVIFAIYVAAYSTARFFIEGLRVDDANVFAGLRQNEWLAIVLALSGVIAAVVMQRRWLRDAD